MKCPNCEAEGNKSIVCMEGATRTLLGCMPFYDAAGAYHHHDPNTIRTRYRCSEGHYWTDTSDGCPCPTCGYAWRNKETP